MILKCSADHTTDTSRSSLSGPDPMFKQPGDRCGQLIAYDVLLGSKYCQRMLKEPDKEPNLTDNQIKALQCIQNSPGGYVTPHQFARLMWPFSDGWRRHSKAGPYGSARGGGMNLAAGGYLGKLTRKGLLLRITRRYGRATYQLSVKGKEALKKAEI